MQIYLVISYISVGLNLFSHKFHKYTQILSVLISANLWAISQFFRFKKDAIVSRHYLLTWCCNIKISFCLSISRRSSSFVGIKVRYLVA